MKKAAKQVHVPYGKSVHGEEEIKAVVQVLRTSTQMGPHVAEMERRVAALFDKPLGLMVNSGSTALYLAADLLDFPAGTEIITPVLTFSTTVAPLVKKGWVPAFVDVEEGTYNMDVSKVEAMITPRTRAMFVPNLIGNLPDWPALRQLAEKYGLAVVEDSADTLGATLNGRSSGAFSDISTTSFYGSHVINCAGNGGMICLRDEALYRRGKLLRSWGRSSSLFVESEKIENRFNVEVDGIPYDAKFVFEEPGYNVEPSEIGAAFGLVQLNKLEENIRRREENFSFLLHFFKRYEEFFILPRQMPGSRTGWLAFPLTIRPSAPFSRRDFQIFMEQNGIQTRTVFTGNILRQPGFKNIACIRAQAGYPEADAVMAGGVLLGCHQGLGEEHLNHISDTFLAFLEHKKIPS
ncbi:MAG: DegT/DnrJ/EryC1/StrS family aminotransferase [Flavobacteriales bacterium]|nr:DegT/DnrJ/EryC1/StrS family aminotransferase [Flavobacteriales bacterium]